MTFRALMLGALLGLAIVCFSYFNDWTIGQTKLVGNLLPFTVFGSLVVLAVGINPLLGRSPGGTMPGALGGASGGGGWFGRFSAGELALITALALAVCPWPGSGFSRYFMSTLAVPAQKTATRLPWQTAQVWSYVPQGAAELGAGHVRHWPEFCRALRESGARPTPAARVWRELPEDMRQLITATAEAGRIAPGDRRRLLNSVNRLINECRLVPPDAPLESWRIVPEGSRIIAALERHRAQLARLPAEETVAAAVHDRSQRARAFEEREIRWNQQRLNRLALTAWFPEHILPMPAGGEALLYHGRLEPLIHEPLLQGAGHDDPAPPWALLWPVIRQWGGAALLLGLATLCLTLVVHPQWSGHERLPYPIAQFVEETTETDAGRRLPRPARQRGFWYGLLAMVLLHTVNGLTTWFPESNFLSIPLVYDLRGLRELFPNAVQVPWSWELFTPRLFPSVVAFAFFLTTEVSLSVGVSLGLWVVFGSMLVGRGISFNDPISGARVSDLITFGSYLGVGVMIAYVGRRHYGQVAWRALGLPGRGENPPGYSVWAARGLVVTAGLATWILHTAGIDVIWAGLMVLLCLLMFLVIARVNAETGVFFIQARWVPVTVLAAMCGVEAMGPTTFVLLAIFSCMVATDSREAWMPYLANGLQMTQKAGDISPRRAVWPLGAMLVLGLAAVILAATMVQFHQGLGQDNWGRSFVASYPFDKLTDNLNSLTAGDRLEAAMEPSAWTRLGHMEFDPRALRWIGLGLVLVIGCALARLRLAWWPLHPVLFVVWGTYPSAWFYASFLLGWALKRAVVSTGGTRAYQQAKPWMIGVIAGEMLMGLAWIIAGIIYYWVRGPLRFPYAVLPG